MDTFTWRFVSHANGSKRKLEFWNLCFSFTDLDIFFSHWNDVLHEEWSKEIAKNHSLYVTLQAREKKKKREIPVVQQVLISWACNRDMQISFLKVGLFFFLNESWCMYLIAWLSDHSLSIYVLVLSINNCHYLFHYSIFEYLLCAYMYTNSDKYTILRKCLCWKV